MRNKARNPSSNNSPEQRFKQIDTVANDKIMFFKIRNIQLIDMSTNQKQSKACANNTFNG